MKELKKLLTEESPCPGTVQQLSRCGLVSLVGEIRVFSGLFPRLLREGMAEDRLEESPLSLENLVVRTCTELGRL